VREQARSLWRAPIAAASKRIMPKPMPRSRAPHDVESTAPTDLAQPTIEASETAITRGGSSHHLGGVRHQPHRRRAKTRAGQPVERRRRSATLGRWPSTRLRVSLPVRRSISLPSHSAIPPSFGSRPARFALGPKRRLPFGARRPPRSKIAPLAHALAPVQTRSTSNGISRLGSVRAAKQPA
jgi:hypothetical protein